MADPAVELVGFTYGEDLEGLPPRSLGYRLLAPLRTESWCAEVEALARRLQAAPYSDHWPPTDLFCSVLLADGRRLVALARYGLADHTPSRRRGGLELVGVVAPATVEVRAALAVYTWLQRRRSAVDDLHQLGGTFRLAEILKESSPPAAPTDPLPVLPVRLWQEGAFLFAASTPSDPDHRLRMLEQGAGASWQWLPLVGPDFPLQTYAQRGPLIAWTPHLAGVALKLDRKPPDAAAVRPFSSPRALQALAGMLVLAVVALLAGNLWSLQDLRKRIQPSPPTGSGTSAVVTPSPETTAGGKSDSRDEIAIRDRFVDALRSVLDQDGAHMGQADQAALVARYERLVKTHTDLRVRDDDTRAKCTIAALSVLGERSADRIEDTVRRALSDKGFSDRLIKAACDHVHEQFTADLKVHP
jgi:hypothetical protein